MYNSEYMLYIHASIYIHAPNSTYIHYIYIHAPNSTYIPYIYIHTSTSHGSNSTGLSGGGGGGGNFDEDQLIQRLCAILGAEVACDWVPYEPEYTFQAHMGAVIALAGVVPH